MTSQSLLRHVIDAETSARGYIATGEREFTAPYDTSVLVVPDVTANLRAAVADDPVQERRAVELSRLADERMKAFARGIERVDAGYRAAALAAMSTGSGRRAMDRFRARVDAFEAAERDLRDERDAALARDWRALRNVNVAMGAAALVTSLVVALLLGRLVVERLRLLQAKTRRLISGQPPGKRLRGRDEIAQLDQAFHEMADVLREREQELRRYSLLADRTRDGILFVDRETHAILDANEAACRMYGYTHYEFKALTTSALRAAFERDRVRTSATEGVDENGVLVEVLARRKDGSTFPAEIAARTAEIDGRELIIAAVRDVTERQRANETLVRALEQALAASKFKSEFVATMSHEIRTPMNGVIGMTELLLNSNLAPTERGYAKTIAQSAETLLRIIDDVLDFSKMEAGKLELETIAFELAPIVEGVAEFLGTGIKNDRVTLMTFIAPDVPRQLGGDPARLRQVLFNIVGNALKFTSRGSIVVSVERADVRGNTVGLRFEVKDTGVGMSPAVVAGLFTPYQQGARSTTRRFGGTGLGLSIAEKLVHLMDGTIGVMSSEGVGTTVTFTARFEACPPAEPAVPASRALEGIRLLAVDDDPAVGEMFRRYAAAWGMRCSVASDASSARELLTAAAEDGRQYDVAIIDYVLPDLNGLEFGNQVRSDPRCADVKLVMITAYAGVVRREMSEKWGFGDFVAKPLRQSLIFDALVSAVNRQSGAGQAAAARAPVVRQPGASGRRLLLVEDNAINRDLAQRQLSTLGYDVVAASDGTEAIDLVKRDRFDAILMDCSMPIMDGFAATRVIRNLERVTGEHATIIAMTASALDRDRERCLEAGMDDYLAKPIRLELLNEMLGRWMPARPRAS